MEQNFELNKQAFGAFLAQLRREKGWTQKDLAEKLYVSDKAVSKWERGLSVPDVSLLLPLAELLGVSVTELLEGRRLEEAAIPADEVEVLVKKSLKALQATGLRRLVVAGGVGANARLREELNAACAARGVRVHYPELHLCTDNGAMIAMAAAMRLQAGQQQANTDYAFDVKPRWPLDAITV